MAYSFAFNRKHWEREFAIAIRDTSRRVQPKLEPEEEMIIYMDSLVYQLLSNVLASPLPLKLEDMEERMHAFFPLDLLKQVEGEAAEMLKRLRLSGKKRTVPELMFPIDARMCNRLEKDVAAGQKFDFEAIVYLMSVLQGICKYIIRLAGTYALNSQHVSISVQDVNMTISAVEALETVFTQGPPSRINKPLQTASRGQLIQDFLEVQPTFMEDINVIVKAFMEPFQEARDYFSDEDIKAIFGNIVEVRTFERDFLKQINTAARAASSSKPETIRIGNVFTSNALERYFDVYLEYTDNYSNVRQALNRVCSQRKTQQWLQQQGFLEATRYMLPTLLMEPVYIVHHYVAFLQLLIDCTEPGDMDFQSTREACHQFVPLASQLKHYCGRYLTMRNATYLRLPNSRRIKEQQAIFERIRARLDGWDPASECGEVIYEGPIDMETTGAKEKTKGRYMYVFDTAVVVCRIKGAATDKDASLSLKLKMKVDTLELFDECSLDSEDDMHSLTSGGGNSGGGLSTPGSNLSLGGGVSASPGGASGGTARYRFFMSGVEGRAQGRTYFEVRSLQEKEAWMAALSKVITKRRIDKIVRKSLEAEQSYEGLRTDLADTSYVFKDPDTADTIVFEEQTDSSSPPNVKGATIVKLVERLTYPDYPDTQFAKHFLITYRSFCTTHKLLDLIIERFRIPLPPSSVAPERAELIQEKLRRPVRLRVFNVVRQWVDRHPYDFTMDRSLLKKLLEFIKNDIKKDATILKVLPALASAVKKITQALLSDAPISELMSNHLSYTFLYDPPEIIGHLGLDVLAMHPAELARQLTLIDSELFRAITPSELVGQPWMKSDKHERAPNVLRCTERFNQVSNWLATIIVATRNLEERKDVVVRFIDLLYEFEQLNNFNGMNEILSGLQQSSVHRLRHTWELLPPAKMQIYEKALELMSHNDNHGRFREKLHAIQPPCVPFIGIYLKDLTFIDAGVKDYLLKTNDDPTADPEYVTAPNGERLINWHKQRLIANAVSEIRQYQNEPYCLRVEPDIRNWLLQSEVLTDEENYQLSLAIEEREPPRAVEAPRVRKVVVPYSPQPHQPQQRIKTTSFTASDTKRPSEPKMAPLSSHASQASPQSLTEELRAAAASQARQARPHGPRPGMLGSTARGDIYGSLESPGLTPEKPSRKMSVSMSDDDSIPQLPPRGNKPPPPLPKTSAETSTFLIPTGRYTSAPAPLPKNEHDTAGVPRSRSRILAEENPPLLPDRPHSRNETPPRLPRRMDYDSMPLPAPPE